MNWKKLKSNIPSHIKVCSKTYEVLWTKAFEKDHVGETRFTEQQIVLLSSMSPKNAVSTLFHEYLHAASHETGANLTENQVLALEKSLPSLLLMIKELQK